MSPAVCVAVAAARASTPSCVQLLSGSQSPGPFDADTFERVATPSPAATPKPTIPATPTTTPTVRCEAPADRSSGALTNGAAVIVGASGGGGEVVTTTVGGGDNEVGVVVASGGGASGVSVIV